MNKKLIAVVIVVLLAIASITGIYLTQNNVKKSADTLESTLVEKKTSNTIEYKGSEGKTALELLQLAATTEISGTGTSAFVTSINGVDADSNSQYWAYTVNGEMASVGAGSYITKDGETIKWELTSF